MLKVTIGIVLMVLAGTALADQGKELTMVCAACHGADGNSPAGSFPTLAGQNANYLYKQLQDIKSGTRSAPLMTGMLNGLTDQNLLDISAYYAGQQTKLGVAKADLVERGEVIYRAGIKRKGIAACTACHSPNGLGNDPAAFPRLAGQWPEYTETQLKAFRTGARNNDGEGKMMQNTALDLSDEEISAVSSYIYGLR